MEEHVEYHNFMPPLVPLKTRIGRAVLAIVIVFAAGGVGALAMSVRDPNLYDKLKKPPLAPPSWLFGVVWPILYCMMAVSLALVFDHTLTSSEDEGRAMGMRWFLASLALNAAWTWIFFASEQYGWAMLEIALLDFTVAMALFEWWSSERLAASLQLPYFAWILFATYLNIGFVWRNGWS